MNSSYDLFYHGSEAVCVLTCPNGILATPVGDEFVITAAVNGGETGPYIVCKELVQAIQESEAIDGSVVIVCRNRNAGAANRFKVVLDETGEYRDVFSWCGQEKQTTTKPIKQGAKLC